jgi:HEAT repeat protein
MSRAPYKYLDYYTSADADLFFGREKETQMMVGEILSSRLLVLFARSGSGKTSLINAGVIPELKRLGYETLYVRFESDPFTSLQNAAREQLQHAGAANDLRGLLQNVTAARQKPLVVFLDQFEEFFLVFADQPALRRDFIAQIASVKYDEQLPVFLVLSLREDYYASLHEFRSAIPSIFQNNANIRLGAFTDEETKRAILLPLAAVGLQMEAGLAEKIIHDLNSSRNGQKRRDDNASGIEPITLQIVCHKLWQMKPKDAATMTAAVYEKCGGAQKILRNHVSELLQKIPLRQQGLVVRIFEALKTRDNTKLYRRLQDLQETLHMREGRRLQDALQKLAEIGVLRHEQRSGDDWYEFKHDHLVGEIAEWLQRRKERINRKRLLYGIVPGALLFLGLVFYFIMQYNSFYAKIKKPEVFATRVDLEIAIYREFNPFGDIITTGLYFDEIRDDEVQFDIMINKFGIGRGKGNNWDRLAKTLELAAGGKYLYEIGYYEAGIDSLIFALRTKDEEIRSKATGALILFGKDDQQVIAKLEEALNDTSIEARYYVANVLKNLRSNDKRVLHALEAALKASSASVRVQAAYALIKLGRSDERVIDLLIRALKDENWEFRKFRLQAVGALGEIKSSNELVINELVAILGNYDDRVQAEAAGALVKLSQRDRQVIDTLSAALNSQDLRIQVQAADILVKLGRRNQRMIDVLEVALYGYSEVVRVQAADALVKLDQSNQQMIDVLVTALEHYSDDVQAQAAGALGEIKPSNETVISKLMAVLGDYDERVRVQAADALVKLGQRDERVTNKLVTVLRDENLSIRGQAAAVLFKLGQRDEQVLGVLKTALKVSDKDVRARAASAMGVLFSSKSMDELLNLLKDPNSDNRTIAAQALVCKGQLPKAIIDEIVRLRKQEDQYPWVRLGAWEAYELIQEHYQFEQKAK